MKISIIGRPNVGKSTLFNRLAGKKLAIVGNVPGITRDRKPTPVDLYGLKFDLLDTPGVDPFSKEPLSMAMNKQSLAAIKESDAVFFVVDSMDGVTEYDKGIASWLRSSFKNVGNRPVVLIKNKVDGKRRIDNPEVLGFGEGVYLSAEHNLGINEIYEELLKLPPEEEKNQKADNVKTEDLLKIAIVGRPNVGKSTLINAIIGDNRLLTGEQAGITRDAISINWKFKNRNISIIDTAGQRKKSKVDEKVESIAILDAWKHIKQANVVVVLMDIQNPLEKQDISIAKQVFDEGKIIIFALNKSDTVPNPEQIAETIAHRVKKEFAQLPEVQCLIVSAKDKKGLIRIFNVALKLLDVWARRIPTSALNRWFSKAISQNPPPLVRGMPIRLKYISQTNCKPPTFVVFANRAASLPISYERYLINHLRKSFGLEGVPLRLFIRQRSNPYAK